MEGSVSKLRSAKKTSNMPGKLFLDPSTASRLTKASQDEPQAHIHAGNCHLLLAQVLKHSFNDCSLQ